MREPLPERRLTTLTPTEVIEGGAPALGTELTGGEPAALGRKRLGVGAWLAIVWLVIIVGAAVLAPILPIPHYSDFYPEIASVGPFHNGAHFLGGDANGHDMLSQLIYGARSSLAVSVGAIAIGLLIGGFLGLVAGYYRGWIDTVLTALFDIMLAFPPLILALALSAFLQGDPTHPQGLRLPNQLVLIIALGIVAIPGLGRITRAASLSWSQRDFVLAARAQGARTRRIVFREVLPNVVPAMFSLALLTVAIAIIAEGVLSLLGAGVRPPTPSWGNIIAINESSLQNGQPYIVFEPVVAMFLTVFALNYLGDVVRSRFDVRESML